MSLIKCPECNREISDKAIACPVCGYPIEEQPLDKADKVEPQPSTITSIDIKDLKEGKIYEFRGCVPFRYEIGSTFKKTPVLEGKIIKISENIRYAVIQTTFGDVILDLLQNDINLITEKPSSDDRKNEIDVIEEKPHIANQEKKEEAFKCPFCQTNAAPIVRKKISTAGWVIFVILLLACFPLCWIGLLIQEDFKVCKSCGIKLG